MINNALKLLILFVPALNLDLYANEEVIQIKVPAGYKRIPFPADSYSGYLQRLPLKYDKIILKWDGSRLESSSYNILAVVDKPVLFRQDLEQCTDYAMRFWADYHKDNNKLDKLYLLDYNGSKKYFKYSGKNYLKYLRWHMAFSNSHSLKKGTETVDPAEKLIPGDMFVQNRDGGIGHVSVVVDAAENEKKERIYLIGYSFMPAQEFHIEDAGSRNNAGAWFTKEGYIVYLMDSGLGYYGKPVIRRFK